MSELACPIPIRDDLPPRVTLAQGGGGTAMHALIGEILSTLGVEGVAEMHDGAVLDVPASRVAFTTDSYVVNPLFFPGGDIGSLAVYGTVNDLAMCGAEPAWLSMGLVLEEGLPMEDLRKVLASMARASRETGVRVVTGDTKVVESGKADGIFVNTAGIGMVREGVRIAPSRIRPGDRIVLSGDIGRHGMAILAARGGLRLRSALESDLAPLWRAVSLVLGCGAEVHCLRDLTRGGLASALNELSMVSGLGFRVEEESIPVSSEVRGLCELLGLDPMHVACEGRFVAFVSGADAGEALKALGDCPEGCGATVIGVVGDHSEPGVVLSSPLGTERFMEMLSGEQLPRIC